MEKKYEKLFAGCVRQKGDEVRHLDGRGKLGHQGGKSNDPMVPGDWEPISLVNHTILQSDLMLAEFRRPL